jgi:hypothetical protein
MQEWWRLEPFGQLDLGQAGLQADLPQLIAKPLLFDSEDALPH